MADPATNRVGSSFDANGNATAGGNSTFDVENRMVIANGFTAPVYYGYAPDNKRVYKGVPTQDQFQNVTWTEELYFYSITGQKLGTYSISGDQSPVLAQTSTNVWFGGRLVRRNGSAVAPDRLGSIGKYYPYGQEKGSGNPSNGTEKFATYTRDAETGLDYADQRYHGPGTARFMSPDPYQASGGTSDPTTWNRYAYVGGDPVNFVDQAGLFAARVKAPETDPCFDATETYGCYGESGGVGSAGGDRQIIAGGGGGGSTSRLNALRNLNKARDKALEALQNPDCMKLFIHRDGSPLTDADGHVLDPATVLKGLVLTANGEGDGGYGTIQFAQLDTDVAGTTTGVGLEVSFRGPYYDKALITLNIGYLNQGFVSENVTLLLHELGHALSKLTPGFGSQNSFASDGFSNSASDANTKLVQDNCTRKLP